MLIKYLLFIYSIMSFMMFRSVLCINIPILVLTNRNAGSPTFIYDIFAYNSSSLFNYNVVFSSYNSSCLIDEDKLQSDLQTVIVYERNRCIDKFIKEYSYLTFIYPHTYVPEDGSACPTNILSGISAYEKSYFSMMNMDGNFVVIDYSKSHESEVFYKTYLHYRPYQFKSLNYKGHYHFNEYNSNDELIKAIVKDYYLINIIYVLLDPADTMNFLNKAKIVLPYSIIISLGIEYYQPPDDVDNFYFLSTKNTVVTNETDNILKSILVKWKNIVEDSFSYNSQLVLSNMAGEIIGENDDDNNYEITNLYTIRSKIYLLHKTVDDVEVAYTYLPNSPELFTISYSPPANLSQLFNLEIQNIVDDNDNEIIDSYFNIYETDLTICDPFYKDGSSIVIALFVYEELFVTDTSIFNTISYYNEIV